MLDLITFVVLSAVTYRVGRFLLLDSLIDELRDKLYLRLTVGGTEVGSPVAAWRMKLIDLMTCSYCITIWIAAAVVVFWSLVVRGEWIGWEFLLVWPAVAAGSLVWWTYIDSEG